MNTELTEREQKLLDYIQKLMVMLSILSASAEHNRRMWRWMADEMNNMGASEIEKDLLDYLKSEFNLNYRKVTDDELFGNNNKTT